MNLKKLRKNYDRFSKRERFILYDAAESRDDKSEMYAIMLATPNEDWIKPDWALQAEQLLKFRLVTLAQRLKRCLDALFWLRLSEREELFKKRKPKDRFFYEYARLNAYFYCVSVDVWQSLYEEMGLDIEAWENKQSELFDLEFVDSATDWQMRALAFNEKEAEIFINKIGKERGIENIVLGYTYQNERAVLRKILKESGFEEFFKN